MNETWRPLGWIRPNLEGVIDPETINVNEACEDTADAMLSGILDYLKTLDPQTTILTVIETLSRTS